MNKQQYIKQCEQNLAGHSCFRQLSLLLFALPTETAMPSITVDTAGKLSVQWKEGLNDLILSLTSRNEIVYNLKTAHGNTAVGNASVDRGRLTFPLHDIIKVFNKKREVK